MHEFRYRHPPNMHTPRAHIFCWPSSTRSVASADLRSEITTDISSMSSSPSPCSSHALCGQQGGSPDQAWVKDGGSLSVVPPPPSHFSAYYPACSDRGSTRRCSAWCSWLSRPRSWSARFDRYGNSLWWFPP